MNIYLLFQTITPRSCAHWCAFIATQHLMDETVQISIIYPGRQLILLRWRHLEFRMKLRTGLQSSGLEHLGTFQDRKCLVFKKPFPCPGYCISVRSMEDSAVAFQRMSFQSTAHKLTCILAVDQRLHLYGSESMCHQTHSKHSLPTVSMSRVAAMLGLLVSLVSVHARWRFLRHAGQHCESRGTGRVVREDSDAPQKQASNRN